MLGNFDFHCPCGIANSTPAHVIVRLYRGTPFELKLTVQQQLRSAITSRQRKRREQSTPAHTDKVQTKTHDENPASDTADPLRQNEDQQAAFVPCRPSTRHPNCHNSRLPICIASAPKRSESDAKAVSREAPTTAARGPLRSTSLAQILIGAPSPDRPARSPPSRAPEPLTHKDRRYPPPKKMQLVSGGAASITGMTPVK